MYNRVHTPLKNKTWLKDHCPEQCWLLVQNWLDTLNPYNDHSPHKTLGLPFRVACDLRISCHKWLHLRARVFFLNCEKIKVAVIESLKKRRHLRQIQIKMGHFMRITSNKVRFHKELCCCCCNNKPSFDKGCLILYELRDYTNFNFGLIFVPFFYFLKVHSGV